MSLVLPRVARAARQIGAALPGVGVPPGLPAILAGVFWADVGVLVAVGIGQAAAFAAGRADVPPTLFAVNVALLVACWCLLPGTPAGTPPGARAASGREGVRRVVLPLVFLVLTLLLGITGVRGQQTPILLVALAVVAVTWGVRRVVPLMVLISLLGPATEIPVWHVDPWTSVARAVVLAATQLFVIGLVVAMEDARRARHAAEALNRRVRDLTIAEERSRMAAEMHDTLGHHLTVVKLDLENALRLRERDPERAWQEVVRARAGAADALEHARRAVRALRSPDVGGRCLPEALADLAASFESTGMVVDVDVDPAVGELSAECRLVVLRAVQEGLLNAVRHSGADRVEVRLECGRDVRLTVVDDGHGADDERLARGFGLRELAGRVRTHGGSLSVDGGPHDAPWRGVHLSVRLPRTVDP